MADYNIYIHDLSRGSQVESQTKAWKPGSLAQSQTQPWDPNPGDESFSGAISAFKSEATDTLASSGVGLAVAQYAPAIAAAAAVVKLSIKVFEGVTTYFSRETGNYHIKKGYENLKATINAGLNPVGTWIAWQKAMQEQRLYNWKQDQERLLIGEGYTNYKDRRY